MRQRALRPALESLDLRIAPSFVLPGSTTAPTPTAATSTSTGSGTTSTSGSTGSGSTSTSGSTGSGSTSQSGGGYGVSPCGVPYDLPPPSTTVQNPMLPYIVNQPAIVFID